MKVKPFYAAGEPGPGRRMLLVSYHFPPGQAAGALRWQKLAPHAAAQGLEMDVLTLDPRELKNPDPSRLDELPQGTRVFGIPARPPTIRQVEDRMAALWRRVVPCPGEASSGERAKNGDPPPAPKISMSREEVAWWPPSPRLLVRTYYAWAEHLEERRWAMSAVREGERIARDRPPSLIASCGPPHMAHEGARRLAKSTSRPFIMDLRDPWSLVERVSEHHASPFKYTLARLHEQRCVSEASLVICNTQPASEAMREAHPQAAGRIVTVLNGYDDEPLPSSPPPDDTFVIAYAGTIYIDRTPRPLFEAVQRVVRDLELGPGDLRVELIGNVDSYGGTPIAEMARQERVAEHVLARPFLPRPEALALLSRASLLVSLPQDSDLAIPSKVYEYLRFPAWVLAMAAPGSATELVLRDTGADVVPRDDVEGLARVLRARYEAFAGGERPSPIAERHPELSRREQARILFDALETRLNTDSPATPGPDR